MGRNLITEAQNSTSDGPQQLLYPRNQDIRCLLMDKAQKTCDCNKQRGTIGLIVNRSRALGKAWMVPQGVSSNECMVSAIRDTEKKRMMQIQKGDWCLGAKAERHQAQARRASAWRGSGSVPRSFVSRSMSQKQSQNRTLSIIPCTSPIAG